MITRAWQLWCRFWFEADGRRQTELFSRGLALLLLVSALVRSIDLEFFFSQQGMIRVESLPEVMNGEWRLTLFSVLTSKTALWVCNAIYLASLALLAFDWCARLGRLPAVFALVISISFIHRNPGAVYGVELVSNFFLFYLCLIDRRPLAKRVIGDLRSTLGSVGFRLMQLQVCIIYGYSGMHKLKSPLWWKGEALWYVLGSQYARFDFSWLANWPGLVAVMSFGTIAWEIYFPALVWVPRVRPYVLIGGVLLHLGIALSIVIPFFSVLMMLTYLLFLDNASLQNVESFFAHFSYRSQVPPPVSDRSYV